MIEPRNRLGVAGGLVEGLANYGIERSWPFSSGSI